jgi:hypothetical protein
LGRDPIDSAELHNIFVVETLHFAVGNDVGSPGIQEILPGGVTVPDDPRVGTFVEGMFLIDNARPVSVALYEDDRITITHDIGGRAPGAYRFPPPSANVGLEEVVVKELSSYAFAPLREGDIALYRGSGNGLAPILLAAAEEGSRLCRAT